MNNITETIVSLDDWNKHFFQILHDTQLDQIFSSWFASSFGTVYREYHIDNGSQSFTSTSTPSHPTRKSTRWIIISSKSTYNLFQFWMRL